MRDTTRATKQCSKCGKTKKFNSFYSTTSSMFEDGKLPICKPCLSGMVDVESEKSVQDVLRQLDKPFIASVWKNCLRADNPFGNYMRITCSLPQYRKITWADSSFGENANGDAEFEPTPNPTQHVFETPTGHQKDAQATTTEVPKELRDKWGYGFKPAEVIAFETLYKELQNNYQLPTASHAEFLKLACISRVKAVNAMAEGDVKTAKDYMTMFKETTSAGKLQPSQFSKADLNGGLDTFGQLVRRVEESVDVIPILPQFRQQPKDKVDVCLWAYINYVRDLKGLPASSYEDTYRWYDKRKEDFENSITDKHDGE